MNLSAVVRLTGINENTLRAWERRYEAVVPTRESNGRRTYTTQDVERIKLLGSLVHEGHAIGRIANLSTEKLQEMMANSLAPHVLVTQVEESKVNRLLAEMISALEKFRLEELHHSLQRARFNMSVKDIVIDLLRPLLLRVGQMTYEGKLSITQEHLLSSLMRDYLGNIHQSLTPYDFAARANAKAVVLTTREGDLHEFNILMAAILSNLYRFRTYYLGPNMPVGDLIDCCERFKADYLVMGFTGLPKERELISQKDFLQRLDQALPRRVTFCCGGAPQVLMDSLSKERKIKSINGLTELDQYFSAQSLL